MGILTSFTTGFPGAHQLCNFQTFDLKVCPVSFLHRVVAIVKRKLMAIVLDKNQLSKILLRLGKLLSFYETI